MGVNSFRNYDHTSQTAGMPYLTRHGTHEEIPDGPTVGAPEKEVASSEMTSNNEATDTPSASVTPTPSVPLERLTDEKADGADDNADMEEERRNSIVQALAHRYTTQSITDGGVKNPFMESGNEDNDSPLNPHSTNFSGLAWAKALVDMVSREGHSFRTSGVAFQNLNVFGYGAGTDYQKDVANVWLELISLARRAFGARSRRIDILRNFDGIVKKGEMLVVLGPPGSGCSTFLKTIAGETNGIYIDDASYFNYQGKLLSSPN